MLPVSICLVVFSGLLGACVGSFLNVCIYRLPREQLSVNRPKRSFCPLCGTHIRWYDNVPLVSWLALGGRCRSCRAGISSRYLLVEALTGGFFTLIALRFLSDPPYAWGPYLALIVLVSVLIVLAFVDWDLRILPDELTIGGMLAAPFVVMAVPYFHTRSVDSTFSWLVLRVSESLAGLVGSVPAWGLVAGVATGAVFGLVVGLFGYRSYWRVTRKGETRPLKDGLLGAVLGAVTGAAAVLAVLWPEGLLHPRIYSLWSALAGMLVGSGLVFLVGEIGSRVFRKPAMGFGDVKLMGLLGAFTGWTGVIAGFFLACIFGSVVGIFLLVRYRSRYLAFGPFLALGCLVMILWPESFEALTDWYLQLLR